MEVSMDEKGRSNIGRRDFLRLAGLSVGAVAATTASKAESARPAARTASASYSDPAGRIKRPWWVKTVDEPTVEIDWDQMQRVNEQTGTVRGPGLGIFGGADLPGQLAEEGAALKKERLENETPGWALKDQAIYNAQLWDLRGESYYLGPQTADTPEDLGVPKWEGSPEEASRIIRSAMRHFGAANVTFMELDENTRKLIYSTDPDGKQVVFEDVDEAYETEEKRVIPDKCKYVIVWSVQMSLETLRRSPTHTACQTTLGAYGRSRRIQGLTQEFLRGLGYQGLGEASINALGIAPAMAVMSGMGELSRLNRVITPEHGPMVRVFKILTDLPVAVDKPIDAGIMDFCRKCKKCAEACPSAALSFDDEPSWETRGGWNNPGHKAWFEDSIKCREYQNLEAVTNCGLCFTTCPFAKKDKAWIHNWIKAGSASIPALDGFFRSMDDAFGYGVIKDQEAWWDLDLPEYGIDTGATVEEV
jgi:reductive dehalogenase